MASDSHNPLPVSDDARARELSYDELSKVERLRASEQVRLEADNRRLREANERLTGELHALVDVFLNAPFLRAERLLYDLHEVAREALEAGER